MLGEPHGRQHALHFASDRAQVPGVEESLPEEIRLRPWQGRWFRHDSGTKCVSNDAVTPVHGDIVRVVFQYHEQGVDDHCFSDPAEEPKHLPRPGGAEWLVPSLRAGHFEETASETALTVKEKKRDRQPLDCGFRGPESNIPEIRQQ